MTVIYYFKRIEVAVASFERTVQTFKGHFLLLYNKSMRLHFEEKIIIISKRQRQGIAIPLARRQIFRVISYVFFFYALKKPCRSATSPGLSSPFLFSSQIETATLSKRQSSIISKGQSFCHFEMSRPADHRSVTGQITATQDFSYIISKGSS